MKTNDTTGNLYMEFDNSVNKLYLCRKIYVILQKM